MNVCYQLFKNGMSFTGFRCLCLIQNLVQNCLWPLAYLFYSIFDTFSKVTRLMAGACLKSLSRCIDGNFCCHSLEWHLTESHERTSDSTFFSFSVQISRCLYRSQDYIIFHFPQVSQFTLLKIHKKKQIKVPTCFLSWTHGSRKKM